MTKNVELFTYALSPYGMKVYWALMFKRIPFDLCYVSPRDQREIKFTGQRTVPVVKIDEEWKQDSGPICQWLDAQFPERPLSGSNSDERDAIIAADQWVDENIIGLSFRSVIDNETAFSAFHNGRILSNTMRKTSGGVPWWSQFIWSRLLRRTAFVVREADQVDRSISMADCRANIVDLLEKRLAKTGFVAGTNTPSYADLSIFAQLVCSSTYGFEGALRADTSPAIGQYYADICRHLDPAHGPDLVPGWKPYGF